MLSIFDKGGHAPCPTPFNLAAHVLARAEDDPDKIALAILSPSGSERWSYGRLKAAILGIGTGLLQAGFQPGDILLMRLGNTVDFPLAYLGAIAVGMVPVPTSSMLTAPEVQRMMDQLSPAGVLHDPQIACPQTDIPVLDIAQLTAMHDLPPAAYHMGDPERLAYIIYTSGTSGVPRAVMHAHRAIWARQMMHRDWYGLSAQDRLLHAGAFNWSFTLGTGLMDPWSVGATALIPAQGVQIEALPLLLHRHDASLFAAVPGVYRKILIHHTKINLPKLRHGLAAGEKLSDTIRTHWAEATGGKKIYEAYGLSECSTFISSSPDAPAIAGSLGRPQIGRKVSIIDEEGPVGTGKDGIICVHRSDPGLMLGYFGAPDETAQKFQGDWFMTGDHAEMTPQGDIVLHGRVDDMMNAGGYRVSPLEIEAALLPHPAIQEIGVTDVEIKEDTRIIVAFYRADTEIPAADLTRYAAERLARYKQPRAWVRLTEMPTNPNGKLSRRALKPLFNGI
ncbi:class I adenylate-forming enzyme family protein [Thalassobius sp. S69A]|uniref:class I adenylate-forming enzyme family protein n=1 Tax=unclassified Thalassovita TaxID=2619711 RepID=UPI000C434B70|nr:benzoate--CoA ligase [Paracoccaceae bacterium]